MSVCVCVCVCVCALVLRGYVDLPIAAFAVAALVARGAVLDAFHGPLLVDPAPLAPGGLASLVSLSRIVSRVSNVLRRYTFENTMFYSTSFWKYNVSAPSSATSSALPVG